MPEDMRRNGPIPILVGGRGSVPTGCWSEFGTKTDILQTAKEHHLRSYILE